ncbi:MAG: hypothetical protein K5876_04055 [Ruminiclostridium sp.]|nr:hypothetical protein [Ruminiclostridium sp.]
MKEKDNIILAECPLYVCRICHTKTGHPHQGWCTLDRDEKPDCGSCIYGRGALCRHPYKRKGGEAK